MWRAFLWDDTRESVGRWCQILAVRRAGNHIKSDVQYRHWSSHNLMFSITTEVVTIVWGLALSCWRSTDFWATKVIWFVLPTSSGNSWKSASQILYLLSCTPVEWCLRSPRKLCACSFQQKVESWIFSFWQKWDDNISVTGFSILGHSDTPNLSPVTMLYRKPLPSFL
jgi:hypothetical protein